jgi:hypothetical protein
MYSGFEALTPVTTRDALRGATSFTYRSGRWVDNLKIDLREIGGDGMDWIELAREGDQ